MASDAPGPQSSELFKEGLFNGTVWVVTGGGTGIGLEIAFQAATLGANIAICGRRKEPLESAAALIESKTGKKVFYATCTSRSQYRVPDQALFCQFRRPLTSSLVFDDLCACRRYKILRCSKGICRGCPPAFWGHSRADQQRYARVYLRMPQFLPHVVRNHLEHALRRLI